MTALPQDPRNAPSTARSKEKRAPGQSYHPKRGEIAAQTRALPGTQIIVRVDGQGFSRLTARAGCRKPHDPLMRQAMTDTMLALIPALQAKAAYTQSDEISLMLGNAVDLHAGRLEKLSTTAAAAATLAFERSDAWRTLRERAGRTELAGTFDARVWCGVDAHVETYLRWRIDDARRNALIGEALQVLRAQGLSATRAQARLHGLRSPQLHQLLFEHGVHFDALNPWIRNGGVALWQTHTHIGHNPTTGQDTACLRRRLVTHSGHSRELTAALLGSVGLSPSAGEQ